MSRMGLSAPRQGWVFSPTPRNAPVESLHLNSAVRPATSVDTSYTSNTQSSLTVTARLLWPPRCRPPLKPIPPLYRIPHTTPVRQTYPPAPSSPTQSPTPCPDYSAACPQNQFCQKCCPPTPHPSIAPSRWRGYTRHPAGTPRPSSRHHSRP